MERYWTNRPARADETEAILRLVRAVHGDAYQELNREYWQWRYLNGTRFAADIVMAEDAGAPVGIQPAALFDWQWGERRLKGVMYTGVLTHPRHRRRGIFRTLIASSNELAAERGAQFSMTMPNDASLPGFLKFGDWRYPGRIPMWIKVVDGKALLSRKLGMAAGLAGWMPDLFFALRGKRGGLEPGLVFTKVSEAPAELDGVFERFAGDVGRLMIRRTAAYWQWRYMSRPDASYSTIVARRGAKVLGAVVTAVQRRLGVEVGLIVDIIAAGGTPVLRALLGAAEEELRGRGVGLTACQATSPLLSQGLVESGYFLPGGRMISKKFHFVYRLTGVEGLPRGPSEIADWHLTFGDSDNA